MKQFAITLSLPRLLTGFATAAIIATVAVHNGGLSLAASNYPPTGNFTGLSCAWDSTKSDYKYTISANYSDRDGGAGGGANAYLGSNTSTGNYQGAGTPSASNALDGTSHDGPSHTWTIYRAVLTDSKWPVQLFVDDVGTSPAVWKSVATAGKPSCPAAPTPAPTPAPAPTPVKTVPKTTTKTTAPAAPAAPALSSDSTATVTTGTTSTSLKIPAGNASSLHVIYGTDPANLSQKSGDQATNGTDVNVVLKNLKAQTNYTYQIVRTLGDATTTSPAGNFTTLGYTLGLKFVDSSGKPVSGIKATLVGDQHAATSDKDGTVSYQDLSGAVYTIEFTYRSATYSQTLDTAKAKSSGDAGIDSLSQTVNVSKLAAAGSSEAKHSSTGGIIIAIVLALLLVGLIFWWVRRRRSRTAAVPYVPPVSQSAPLPVVASMEPVAAPAEHHRKHRASHTKTAPPPEPAPAHMGVSLAEMVIQSMREDASKPHDNTPPPPHVPGR